MIRVVVVDGHPLEAGPEVLLHPRQEPTRVRAKVEPCGLLGRDDELEEPCVTGGLPALQRLGEIEVVPVGGEAPPLLALALGTLPREIGAVRPPARAAAARGVGDLDGAALTLPRVGQEQCCAPGSETLPTASAPAASTGERTPTGAARAPQLGIQGQFFGKLFHVRSRDSSWSPGASDRQQRPRNADLIQGHRPEVPAVPAPGRVRGEKPHLVWRDHGAPQGA